MSEPEVFDLIVIGAGPAGENIAQYATEGTDLTAVLIDRELFGGECSYYACMPSKALLRPIEVAATSHHLKGVRDAKLDVDALISRRNYWVSNYEDSGQVKWAKGAGLEVIRGDASFAGPRQVRVSGEGGDRLLEARTAVVIATGTTAFVPDLYADCAPWGSRDATGIREVPDRLIIVGGGVVACEAATWLAAMGSHVTMIVRDERVLPRSEPFASEIVATALRDAGVDLRLKTDVSAVRRDGARDTGIGQIHGGPVTVTLGDEEVEADEILVAVGRCPALDGLGLDVVGLDESSVLDGDLPDWLLAVGDASGEAALTHWGKYRARVIGAQIAARALGHPEPYEPTNVPVPQAIFTDPQVGSVGLTEAEAREAGHDVVVASTPWSSAAGSALLQDDAKGGAQLVVDASSHRVLGATFVGPGAAELVHAATIAIVGGVPTEVLRHAVPSYPTASELWLRLLEDLPPALRDRPTS